MSGSTKEPRKHRRSTGKRLRFEILKRDGFRCQYCGAEPGETKLHVDHIVPKAKGGSDDPVNLITACADCNLGKAARQLHETSAKVAAPLETAIARVEAARRFAEEQAAAQRANTALAEELSILWKERVNSYLPAQVSGAFPRLVSELPFEELEIAINATADAAARKRHMSAEHRSRYFFAVIRNRREEMRRESMTEEEIAEELERHKREARESFDRRNYDAAVRSYRAALRCSRDPDLRFGLGRALLANGEVYEARDIFRGLYDDGQFTWPSCFNLALAEEDTGNRARARELFVLVAANSDWEELAEKAEARVHKFDESERARREYVERLRAKQAEEAALNDARKTAARKAGRSFASEVAEALLSLLERRSEASADDLACDPTLTEIARRHHRNEKGLRIAIGRAMGDLCWSRLPGVVPAVYARVELEAAE